MAGDSALEACCPRNQGDQGLVQHPAHYDNELPVINLATGSVGHVLIMTGNQRLLQYNIIIITILNAILGLVLIPRYGMIGAAGYRRSKLESRFSGIGLLEIVYRGVSFVA